MVILSQVEMIPLVSLITNVCLAMLTAVYVIYTQKLVKHHTEPCVIVYVERGEVSRYMINIVIANVGGSIARDITFELDGEIPRQELHGVRDPKFVKMESGPLITGLPGLAAGAKRIIYWGDSYGLLEEFHGKRVWVKCKYRAPVRENAVVEDVMSTDNILEVDSMGLEEQPYVYDRSESHLGDIARNTDRLVRAVESCQHELARRPFR